MDSGILTGIVTAVFIAVFIGIVWWAYSKGNKQRFEEDARMPFDDNDTPAKQGEKQ
jgi:cytochrome c oxidase cbb3-type subunit 4